jgi:DNA ligase-1
MLKSLQDLVNELNMTNSNTEKKNILAKYPQCKQLLMYTYNPFYQFNVTSDNLKKRSDLIANLANQSIIELLNSLKDRIFTGHDAIGQVNKFISENKEYTDLIYNIIDKNLKIRLDVKTINKVFPNCVPTFEVALANKYEDRESKIDFSKEMWFASHKMDGVRCIIRKENGAVTCWSRSGNRFEVLSKIEEAVKNLSIGDIVLDGEICIVDDEGREDFQGVMKEIRRKNHTIKYAKYMIFDCLSLEEFDTQKSDSILLERLGRLKGELEVEISDSPNLEILRQTKVKSKEHLTEMMKEATDSGWEGLIIRKNVGYEGKRSNNLLKVKKMHDAEYVVKSIEVGPLRMINKETGLEEEVETLARVNIEHKGNNVGVGSGFTIEQRKYYYQNPNEIIGKVVTVQFFSESQNQDGKYSLRFPVFKCLHGDKREI